MVKFQKIESEDQNFFQLWSEDRKGPRDPVGLGKVK